MKQLPPIAVVALILFVTGCGIVPHTTGAVPPVSSTWTTASGRAPTAAECRAAAHDDKMSCYQIFLDDVLKTKGIDSAMSSLTQLASAEQFVRENSHMFAHSLGLAAFTTPAELASVFTKCSPGFQSGCYHGVIQGYFLDQHRKSPRKTAGAEEINSLCRDFRGGNRQWLLFQCAHGLGHGLELVDAHDLPRALGGCDLVADAWERTACYGGAFMENIVSVTNPHQTAEGIAGRMEMDAMSDGMAGMDMGDAGDADSSGGFKKFDPADPLYPCSALADRYGSQCYLIQTSLMLFENGGDFSAAAKTCEAAPEAFRVVCFVSLGRDANSYAGSDAVRAAESCEKAPPSFRPWCHTGVARNLVDITSRPSDGLAYCSSLTGHASKVTCYSSVGEEIQSLSPDTAKRKEFCSAAPPPFDGACLYGAGVIHDAPAGLAKDQ